MPCCCIKTLNLCDTPICGILELDKVAVVGSGDTYDLVLDFMNLTLTLTQGQIDGENISFDISALNENFQYTGKIYDAAGDPVTITSGGEDYDCIKFKTVVNVAIT